MWPWESEPKSIATGILDDETYDWLAVVGGMLRSGGRPVVVYEERLAEANELGRARGSPSTRPVAPGSLGCSSCGRTGWYSPTSGSRCCSPAPSPRMTETEQ